MGGEVMAYFWWSKKFLSPPPDPPLSQKFADPLTILKFADLRLPTPVFWSSHMYNRGHAFSIRTKAGGGRGLAIEYAVKASL